MIGANLLCVLLDLCQNKQMFSSFVTRSIIGRQTIYKEKENLHRVSRMQATFHCQVFRRH